MQEHHTIDIYIYIKVLWAWKCSFNFLGYISFNISHVLSLELFLQFSGIYLLQYMSCAKPGSIPPIFGGISSSIYVIFLAFSICISFILEFFLVFLNPNDIPHLHFSQLFKNKWIFFILTGALQTINLNKKCLSKYFLFRPLSNWKDNSTQF